MAPALNEIQQGSVRTFHSVIASGETKQVGGFDIKGTAQGFIPSSLGGTSGEEVRFNQTTAGEADNWLMTADPDGTMHVVTAISEEEARKLLAQHAAKKQE